jgi:Flp pilus assembly protein CpaB
MEQLLASRRGAVAIAAAAALLAGILLYLFVQHYRQPAAAVAPVNDYAFVASRYIPAGTPAAVITSEGLLRRTPVPSTQLVAGAVGDPSVIANQVSTTGIAAGQQVTVTDFTKTNATLGAYLTGDERAIAVPLDPAHGLTTYLAQGDTVDVMDDSGAETEILAQNVPILANTAGDVVLRVSDAQSLEIASASDNAKLWLALRPSSGALSSVKVGQGVKN